MPDPTQLLFRDRQDDRTFDAFVVDVTTDPEPAIILDRTLFYPEGGGQAADRGTLTTTAGTVRILDVRRRDGVVHHVVGADLPLPARGDPVRGELDWGRRYRHMQRHSAEHLLAQAFLRIDPAFRVQAVSMLNEICTLDLEGQPTADDARAAELLLRDIIARDLNIEAFEVEASQLDRFPLRRPPKVSGQVRLVTVKDESGEFWEVSACGGTHLRRTSLVAPVVILRLERIRAGLTRIHFMAGEEATDYLQGVYGMARTLAMSFSTGVETLAERVEVLRDEQRRLTRELNETRAILAGHVVRTATVLPGTPPLRLVELHDPLLLTEVLQVLLSEPNSIGVGITPDGRCGVTSTTPEIHAGTLLRTWLAVSGGRGGGKPELAQGQTDPGAFRQAVHDWALGRDASAEDPLDRHRR